MLVNRAKFSFFFRGDMKRDIRSLRINIILHQMVVELEFSLQFQFIFKDSD
jgi:hypothetical protein